MYDDNQLIEFLILTWYDFNGSHLRRDVWTYKKIVQNLRSISLVYPTYVFSLDTE